MDKVSCEIVFRGQDDVVSVYHKRERDPCRHKRDRSTNVVGKRGTIVYEGWYSIYHKTQDAEQDLSDRPEILRSSTPKRKRLDKWYGIQVKKT